MEIIKVKQIRKLLKVEPTIVHKNDDIKTLVFSLTDDPMVRSLFVVDENKKLIGIITLRDIVGFAFKDYIDTDKIGYGMVKNALAKKAEDLISLYDVYVKEEDSFAKCFNLMFNNNLESIPVVDNTKGVIGVVNMLELLTTWLELDIREEISKILNQVGDGA